MYHSLICYSMHRSNALWDYYYKDSPNFTSWTKNSQITIDGSYYVLNVYFTLKNAQCIVLNSDPSNKLLVSTTTFYELESTDSNHWGLAIYQENGSCIQYHVCSIHPKTDILDVHSYIADEGTIIKNYFIESSISGAECHTAPFHHSGSDTRINQVNVSKSNIHFSSACSTVRAIITSCTFSNNTSKTGTTLLLGLFDTLLSLCNIVDNIDNSTDSEGMVVKDSGNLIIIKSIFKNNIINKFFTINRLLTDIPAMISVFDCYFDGNTVEPSNGENITVNTASEFSNVLYHYSTNGCDAVNTVVFIVNDFKCKTNHIIRHREYLFSYAIIAYFKYA